MKPFDIYTDHETRIRVLEQNSLDLKTILQEMRSELNSKFLWMIIFVAGSFLMTFLTILIPIFLAIVKKG